MTSGHEKQPARSTLAGCSSVLPGRGRSPGTHLEPIEIPCIFEGGPTGCEGLHEHSCSPWATAENHAAPAAIAVNALRAICKCENPSFIITKPDHNKARFRAPPSHFRPLRETSPCPKIRAASPWAAPSSRLPFLRSQSSQYWRWHTSASLQTGAFFPMNEPAANQSCWDFVVKFYAGPGISQACLELQDRLGVDVSFLLTVLFYAKHRNIDLSAEEIAALDRSISAWRDEVIRPLRRLRRRVKASDLLNSSTEGFYQRIKADELLAEQLEIGTVAQQLEQMQAKRSISLPRRDLIERVAKHFAESSGQHPHLNDARIQRAISTLHDAAR